MHPPASCAQTTANENKIIRRSCTEDMFPLYDSGGHASSFEKEGLVSVFVTPQRDRSMDR
jgi:hypothetical protein